MASFRELLARLFGAMGLGGREPAEGWVEPGNAITRSILAGTAVDLPEVEPSPLAPAAVSAFEEKPIPPLGVEPPLIRPHVAPDWESPMPQPTVAETPVPRVAAQVADEADGKGEETRERKKRRWWRAA